MMITFIKLQNWRNFSNLEVSMGDRLFIVGPNACGKSNFLDAFRFLRDLAANGLQKAVAARGGLSKIRNLNARREPVSLEIHFSGNGKSPGWEYGIVLKQETRGHRNVYLDREWVWKEGRHILARPDKKDHKDDLRKTQSHLEQIIANVEFREIAETLKSISYLHLVPQLVRHPEAFTGNGLPGDPFGRSFLEKVTKTSPKTRKSRLSKIERVLSKAVPQLKQLTDVKDALGVPHLEAIYEHWRPGAGKQREDQFSDGTLRLIGLLWAVLENDSVLLLEEPELSLNDGVVARIPEMLHKLKNRKKQLFISTHSYRMLSDGGIGGEEVLMLKPDANGTLGWIVSRKESIKRLLDAGLTVADAVMPSTAPEYIQGELF